MKSCSAGECAPFVERLLGHALGLLEGVPLQSQQILYPGVQFLCLEDFHGRPAMMDGLGSPRRRIRALTPWRERPRRLAMALPVGSAFATYCGFEVGAG